MLALPDDIRRSTGALDDEAWAQVRRHPGLGVELLANADGLPASASLVAYQTHERVNGKGYPRQHHGVFIHGYAKIVQVADVYDAMTSPRPYRGPTVPYKAMVNLVRMVRSDLLSKEIAKAFLECMSLFPVGSIVQLDDGRTAKVVGANGRSYGKPVVSVLDDTTGDALPPDQVHLLDLKQRTERQIVKAFPAQMRDAARLMDGF
jgi:HD-GYP domain-containing protein (c-di-GMP phosphodiesterase class II)